MTDAATTWREMRGGVVAYLAARDFVSVRGPDARSWLQGQLSQDVLALGLGGSADSLLLTPQGKVVALVRVTRTAEDELVLDADGGSGEAIVERLMRFRLRVKADVTRLEWHCVALRGPRSADVAASLDAGPPAGGTVGDGWIAVPWSWPGDDGVDLLGARATIPPGVPEADGEAVEAARISAGVPRMGSELTERTIPHEAGIVKRTVNFEKGCYTGQELVARIDARGSRVPRVLRGVVFEPAGPDGPLLPDVGTELVVGDRAVGALTSVALSPATGAAVGLAYVRREIEPPQSCDSSVGVARVESLPMLDLAPAGSGDPAG